MLPSRRLVWSKHSLLALLVVSLTACSPTFNWRVVKPADLAVVVMLPDKPASLTQRIQLDGRELVMTMTGAKADDFSFTVACAALPDAPGTPPEALAASRAAVLAAMRAGMLQNIGLPSGASDAVEVPIVDGAGATRGQVAGVRVNVQGRVQGRAVQMQALFVGEGRRACQAVALGAGLPADEARTFLESVRLVVSGA